MDAKQRLEIASGQLDRVLGFFARVEAKASFVFAIDSTVLALVAVNIKFGDRGGPDFRDRMAAWLRWILGSVTPPISPRLPA